MYINVYIYIYDYIDFYIHMYFEVRKYINAKCAGTCEMVGSAATGIYA